MDYELDIQSLQFIGPRAEHLEHAYQKHCISRESYTDIISRRTFYDANVWSVHRTDDNGRGMKYPW